MRWSAARLRWLLLGGVLLLAGVVAGFFGLARWKAGKIWREILARSGVNLRQESNGITWSQSSGGRTVFTLHAAKATPLGNNRWELHDAVLILYGRERGRDDRISGSEIEYDQNQGVARAAGEVHMDLQVPEPEGKRPVAGSRPALDFAPEANREAMDTEIIHVRTSGLVYMRKMGLAATGQPTEFRYGGTTCTSRGAEFDTGQSMVRLLADVRMTGTMRDAPFTLTAGHAELSREANTVDLTAPALRSEDRAARAGHALLHLRKDGFVQAAEASGAVELREGTRMIGAPQMTAVFGEENRPEQARMFSGVTYMDRNGATDAQGTAGVTELHWGADGVLNSATAKGAVRFAETATAQDGAPTVRQMHAEQAAASFGAEDKRAVLQRMHLVGGAEFGSKTQPAAGRGGVENAVSGDDLTADFGAGPGGTTVVQRLDGTGHTVLEQTGADGARQRSSGDVLQAEFAPVFATRKASGGASAGAGVRVVQVSSAVQTGHVAVESWTADKASEVAGSPASGGGQPELTTGHAAKAVYEASAQTVTLTAGNAEGRATVEGNQGEIAAPEIVVHQGSGDADASGGVVATSVGNAGQAATHVLANRARLLHAAGLSEFYGEAGRPVQMFQGGSQVQAAEVTLDGKTHGMAARPGGSGELVEAVFATEPSKESGGARRKAGGGAGNGAEVFGVAGGSGVVDGGTTAAGRSAVRVSAARMDYDEGQHEASFAGSVHMRGVMGEVFGDRGVAFLNAGKPAGFAGGAGVKTAWAKGGGGGAGMPDLGGSLERMVVVGDVRLTQPGRTGVGEQLTYTAATDSLVLTGTPGKPPKVTGEQGSVVTGATLVFGSADSTIVVAGTERGPKTPGGVRVHTETDLKKSTKD